MAAIDTANRWIWQHQDWPLFSWDASALQPLLRDVRLRQGELLGQSKAFSHDDLRVELDNLLQSILTSSAIEGERLNVDSVRSSLAKRLGVDQDHPYPVSDRSEGVASMTLDAISNLEAPLTEQRLYQWHRWLFPDNDQSLTPIRVAQLRGSAPMQVVSGRLDRPVVHFEAPPRQGLENELDLFVNWFNASQKDPTLDPLLRAGIAHFWFVTLHPFDDGNGRLTRAVTDLALAQSESRSARLYAMSASILERRTSYYAALETSQRASIDITDWLVWFLETLLLTLQQALSNIDRTVQKARFWQRLSNAGLYPEQVKVLNRLLEGDFELGISAAQYGKVARVSKPTATRHLADLFAKGYVEKQGAGRSTRYNAMLC